MLQDTANVRWLFAISIALILFAMPAAATNDTPSAATDDAAGAATDAAAQAVRDDTAEAVEPAGSDEAGEAGEGERTIAGDAGSAEADDAAEPTADDGPTPPSAAVAVIETLHEALLTTMKGAEELGYEGRRDRLRPVVAASYDTDFMASKAAGRHWRDFAEEDRERWLDKFRQLTVANYAGRFSGYSGQSFETQGEEPATHETRLVRTVLKNPTGEDVKLAYRLRETDAGWRIIDVYMHGTVSELALRRADYTSVLEREGLESLLTRLESTIADLAAHTGE